MDERCNVILHRMHYSWRLKCFQLFTNLAPQFFLPYSHSTSYLTCHIIPHVSAPVLLIFHLFLKTKTGNTRCKQTLTVLWRRRRLYTLSELSRYRQVRTRSVTSNILAQQRRRNGNETWRRRSCQCEHLHSITHEKILLNGDVPRRNGNVTYRVNRP
jgi:hypothetical protein